MNHKKFSFLLLAFISAHILAVRFPKPSEELDLEYYVSGNQRHRNTAGVVVMLVANCDHLRIDRDAYIRTLDILYRVNKPEDKKIKDAIRMRILELMNEIDKAYEDV